MNGSHHSSKVGWTTLTESAVSEGMPDLRRIILSHPFEPAQLGDVVEDQHRALRRRAEQRRAVDRERPRLRPQAGLTPRQALTAATRDAARCMKLDQNLGTIEPGKWADFVALNADPLADIKNIRAIDSVWIAGNRVAR